MKSLLIVNSSGRVTRSITRHLTARFAGGWSARNPTAVAIQRDVGLNPPPTVNEAWIAAAYSDARNHTPELRDALRTSEELIAELAGADAILFGAPMYNFGMPAQLKAYFDQVVRVGRTFAFDPQASEQYRPLLAPKPVVIITSAGDGAVHPGGPLEHLNCLEPHLRTILGFIGLTDLTFIRAGYDEFQDDRARRSLRTAEAAVDEVLDRLLSGLKDSAFQKSPG